MVSGQEFGWGPAGSLSSAGGARARTALRLLAAGVTSSVWPHVDAPTPSCAERSSACGGGGIAAVGCHVPVWTQGQPVSAERLRDYYHAWEPPLPRRFQGQKWGPLLSLPEGGPLPLWQLSILSEDWTLRRLQNPYPLITVLTVSRVMKLKTQDTGLCTGRWHSADRHSFYFFAFCCTLGPHPRRIGVPRLGV